jgi:hypothetical protein
MKLKHSLLTAVLLAGTLTACAPHYVYAYRVPPPPPQPYGGAAYGYAPGPGYVWTDGFYDLRGDRWVWVQGRYMRPPHPYAVWVAPRWVETGHGWRFHEGRWR